MTTERPMKILIVDDLDVNRDLLLRRMHRMGHEAGEAINGRDALDKMDQETWDLVLLDITMPLMDGYETLRHLRADPRHAQIPVVMVSAIDDTDSVVRCLELGADDYVTKPFNPLILQARIESSLAKKRLADQRLQLLNVLAREMEIGRRIQIGFLPGALPVLEGWSMGAYCQPARQVGGDFYDAFTLLDGSLVIAVADVCDKGIGAALYMALFRTMLRTTTPQFAATMTTEETLLRTVSLINDYIATVHGSETMFATLFFAIVNPGTGTLQYVNAGHETPFIRHAGDGTLSTLEVTGPAVGLIEGARWTIGVAQLDHADILLAYTDGMTEAAGASGEYGLTALRKVLLGHESADAQSLIGTLQSELTEHVGRFPSHDDVTLFSLQREFLH
jgi:sigma-B regulation protein RsbU (phosphoserine phosphatase)